MLDGQLKDEDARETTITVKSKKNAFLKIGDFLKAFLTLSKNNGNAKALIQDGNITREIKTEDDPYTYDMPIQQLEDNPKSLTAIVSNAKNDQSS